MGKLASLMDIIFKGKFFDWFYHFCISKSVLTNKHVFKKQSKRLKAIMMYATKHCDYYRKLGLKISSSDDLFKFPVLDKQLIRKLSTDSSPFVSDQIHKMVVYNGFTGGSTGEPLRLILSPGIDSLFQNRVWKEIGFKKGDIILAMDGTKLSTESILKDEYLALTSKKQLPYGGYALSSLYLKDTNMSLYFDKICELKPAFIRGYPSFVYRVARYILDNDLTVGFKVKGIELTSEMAYPFQICVIEKAFRTKVYLQYH